MNAEWVDRNSRRTSIVAIALLSVGLIGLMISFRHYSAIRRAAREADSDAREIQRLAGDIIRSRHRRRVASLEVEAPDAIARRIENALAEAAIEPTRLLSLDPQAPERIGRTPYQLRETQIVMEQLTMQQIIRFGRVLRDLESGMTVRDLNLTPRTSSRANGEAWDVRLTLTQMIFSPISDS